MVSESPVIAEYASCGSPHSGPCTRGKSTKSASAAGAACARSSAEVRRLARSARCGALKPTSAAVRRKSAAAISTALRMVCV